VEIQHFFEVYKDLEPGKEATIGGWSGRDSALDAIAAAKAAHR
jgi:inorganic pyrophosphatase